MTTTSTSACLPFLLGVCAHLGLFIRGEWHLKAPAIVIIHVLLVVLLGFHSILDGPSQGLLVTFITSIEYLTGLFGSIAVYRLFFHGLRPLPGPRLAALSKLWHVWKCRESHGHHVLESLHKQYGDMVRTGKSTRYTSITLCRLLTAKAQTRSRCSLPGHSRSWMGLGTRTPDPIGMTCFIQEYHPSSPEIRNFIRAGGSYGKRLWLPSVSTDICVGV